MFLKYNGIYDAYFDCFIGNVYISVMFFQVLFSLVCLVSISSFLRIHMQLSPGVTELLDFCPVL